MLAGRTGAAKGTRLLRGWSCLALHAKHPLLASSQQWSYRGYFAGSCAMNPRAESNSSRRELDGARLAEESWQTSAVVLRCSRAGEQSLTFLPSRLRCQIMKFFAPHAPAAAGVQVTEERVNGDSVHGSPSPAPTGWLPLTFPLLWQACSQPTEGVSCCVLRKQEIRR